MISDDSTRRRLARGWGVLAAILVSISSPTANADFHEDLARIDESLKANPEMAAQIRSFGDRETTAVLDYVSRLEPPEALRAPAGWKNPDFRE